MPGKAMHEVRPISVVVAALDEAKAIEGLLRALAVQTVLPDEVIIADGGSTDETIQIIERVSALLPYSARALLVPGKVARGRNAAIGDCRNSFIAVTDADCVPTPRWLEFISDPLVAGRARAVAGGYKAITTMSLQRAIGTFTWVRLDRVEQRFLPSHRSVAFEKSVWREVGGYNERVDSGEDTLFDIQINRICGFENAPAAIVDWAPRVTIAQAIRQQVFYGAGDGQARNLLGYHAAIAAFCVLEGVVLFARGPVQVLAACCLLGSIIYFFARHIKLFGCIWRDVGWVALLTVLLPPCRLGAFLIGLVGGSVRPLFARS